MALTGRKEINSAIGTWSGFIYQGLCGLLVALKMIEEDWERTKDYNLQLDGYEDFSILDGAGQVVSIHQCKCIKGRKNYDQDLMDMKEKRGKLKNIREDAKSFFHCNEVVTIKADLDIEAYPFTKDKTSCEPGEIKNIIQDVVRNLKAGDAKAEDVLAKLESLINSKVLNTQQIYFDTPQRLYAIARDESIPFKDIENICKSHFIYLSGEDILTQIKTRYINQFNERVAVNGGIEEHPDVEKFIVLFSEMDSEQMKLFMQRIHPKEKFEYSLNGLVNTCSKERINRLFNLIIRFPIHSKLHWVTPNSIQTPTTLEDDQEIELTCIQIYENRANFDAMWIYDWFVGKIDESEGSVEDIRKRIREITTVDEPEEDNSIFHEKKVGIMTIKDKQNGKFD